MKMRWGVVGSKYNLAERIYPVTNVTLKSSQCSFTAFLQRQPRGLVHDIPVGTPLTVKAGATLDLANRKSEFVISSFAGSGTVMNGNVTVTTAIRAKCEDLFNGRHASFTDNVTVAGNKA